MSFKSARQATCQGLSLYPSGAVNSALGCAFPAAFFLSVSSLGLKALMFPIIVPFAMDPLFIVEMGPGFVPNPGRPLAATIAAIVAHCC